MNINIILFNKFETLDAFGPIEIWGRVNTKFTINLYSQKGGIIRSSQSVPVITRPFEEIQSENNILFIPGGKGTRELVKNREYIKLLELFAKDSLYVITVCTGSVLFSKTGLLDGKRATSNKKAMNWAYLEAPNVNWVKKARWVKDGNIYTSSGISAGMDMALGFISDLLGYEVAKRQSIEMEYDWKEDSNWDPFYDLYS